MIFLKTQTHSWGQSSDNIGGIDELKSTSTFRKRKKKVAANKVTAPLTYLLDQGINLPFTAPHTAHRAHRLIEKEELSGLHCEKERANFSINTFKRTHALPVSDQLIHSVNEIFFLFWHGDEFPLDAAHLYQIITQKDLAVNLLERNRETIGLARKGERQEKELKENITLIRAIGYDLGLLPATSIHVVFPFAVQKILRKRSGKIITYCWKTTQPSRFF